MRTVTFRSAASREVGLNIPACYAFFRCTETSGDTITDAKNGISWKCPGNLSINPAPLLFNQAGSVGTVQPVMANADAPSPIVGAWPAISTQSVLFMAAARINNLDNPAFRLALGDINSLVPGSDSNGFGMSDTNFHCALGKPGAALKTIAGGQLIPATFTWVGNGAAVNFASVPTITIVPPGSVATNGSGAAATAVLSGGTTGTVTSVNYTSLGAGYANGATLNFSDGTNTASADINGTLPSLAATTQGQDVLVYSTYVPGTGLDYRAVQLSDPGSGTVILDANFVTTGYGNDIAPFQPWPVMRAANAAFYGMAMFVFQNGLPPNILSAILNMGGMWRAGNKYLDGSLIGAT